MSFLIFRELSENFPATSWWLYSKALIIQLMVPCRKYLDFNFLYGLYFIRSVLQNCSPNILPYGPHNWLIRAYKFVIITSKWLLIWHRDYSTLPISHGISSFVLVGYKRLTGIKPKNVCVPRKAYYALDCQPKI